MLAFLEVVFFFFFISTAVTQVILPLWRGTVIFPVFRREADLLSRLREEKQKTVEKALEKEIKKEGGVK